jgi:hypothetical protein
MRPSGVVRNPVESGSQQAAPEPEVRVFPGHRGGDEAVRPTPPDLVGQRDELLEGVELQRRQEVDPGPSPVPSAPARELPTCSTTTLRGRARTGSGLRPAGGRVAAHR